MTFRLLPCKHPEKVKINRLKYHYNNFDKKVDISDEKKIETQCGVGGLTNLIGDYGIYQIEHINIVELRLLKLLFQYIVLTDITHKI